MTPLKNMRLNNPTKKNDFSSQISLIFLLIGMCCASHVSFAANYADLFNPTFNESLTYDDNIYRVSAPSMLGKDSEMSDFINRASATVNLHNNFGQQMFDVNLQVDDNHYFFNKALNHISTEDSAILKWKITDRFFGKLGAEFNRSLAGFANTQFLSADILSSPSYYFDSSYQLNSSWRFDAGFRETQTLHSAASRNGQNTDSQIMNTGVTFLTSSGNSIGANYSLNNSQFPNRTLSSVADTAFQENTAKMLLKYNYSPKSKFEGEAGYKFRKFEHLSNLDFDGEIWRIKATYLPTVKTTFTLSVFHEPTSFVELVSNYYVSQGVMLSSNRLITEKITVSGQIKMENQKHTGNSASKENASILLRNDNLYTVGSNLNYNMNSFTDLSLAYQFGQRSSNRQNYNYLDNSLTATIRLNF